ncbi:hypothetical protein Athai_50050 [Actinocatenispora thailandica]|uniref:Integral membrane protein n=1 Tax=Actinocatenispora thailandica TaxID=227318 RepID=A0A7R7DU54_9ACTN|nr:hypothetical protein [Actinocatenispora thailandica]BCJ37502.1 hypothetical protein Athai_50050 [Actinocatenispora thailandica]
MSDGERPVRSMGRGTRTGRWVGAIALVTVAALLAMVSVLAVFARNQLLNTDRFVTTMAPLARDPVVQDAIARRLTTEVTQRADLEKLGRDASAWLQKQGAPPAVNSLVGPAVNGAESFISRQITAIVHSDTFAQAWDAAIRAAHKNLDAVLTGHGSTAIKSQGTTVSVDLGALIATVKQRLEARGFGLASKIPKVNVEFVLFSSAQLPKLRNYVTLLNTVATWLPWICLVLLALGVAVAPAHRRGLLVVGVFLAVGALLVLAAMAVLRAYYLNNLPAQVKSPDAVAHILDQVLARPYQAYRVIAVLGALLAIACWLAGPARPAVGLRHLTGRGLDATGAALGRTGVPLGPVPRVLRRYHVAIDIAALVLALLGFVLTGAGVSSAIGFGLGLLVLVLVVEILARATEPAAPPAATPAPGAA